MKTGLVSSYARSRSAFCIGSPVPKTRAGACWVRPGLRNKASCYFPVAPPLVSRRESSRISSNSSNFVRLPNSSSKLRSRGAGRGISEVSARHGSLLGGRNETISGDEKLEAPELAQEVPDRHFLPPEGAESAHSSRPDNNGFAESYSLDPEQRDRLVSRVQKKKATRFRKAIKNNVLKFKGTWSYDWRIPLLDLKRQHQQGQTATRAPNDLKFQLSGQKIRYSNANIGRKAVSNIKSRGSFAAHIEALTSSSVPRVRQRYVYSDGEQSSLDAGRSHVQQVRNALLYSFEHPSMEPFLSSTAFELALLFCFKHSMTATARQLLNLMADRKILIDASTFNIMLWGAAESKDLHNFTYLLKLMIHRGIKADAMTWVAFVATLESKSVKRTVEKTMHDLGLLQSPPAVQALAAQMIDVEAGAHLKHDHDLSAFSRHLDAKYGAKWMTVQSANKLCQLIGEAGDFGKIGDLLQEMTSRGCPPNDFTLAIILEHCSSIEDMAMAIRFLRHFERDYDAQPNEYCFQSLFLLAWKARKYNCCKVIWQVACLRAAVPYRLQQMVFQSLLRNTPEHPTESWQRWRKEAGKVISGVGREWKNLESSGSPSWDERVLLMRWLPKGESREQGVQVAKQSLARDLRASVGFSFDGNFVRLLSEANDLDLEWERTGKEEKDIIWKVLNAIQVVVERLPPKAEAVSV